MDEIKITYETLYELLRREKSREELQKLEDHFLEETSKYLQEKNNIINKAGESLFANEEKRKTQIQIDNAKRIIKSLYHKREQKIVSVALDTNKTGKKTVSTANMLDAEKELFNQVLSQLEKSKQNMLKGILEGQTVVSRSENIQEADNTQKTENSGELGDGKPKDLKEDAKSLKSVRFKEEVPKFMGTDLKVYGPYGKDDESELPEQVAELLIKKGKANEIT